MTRRRKRRKGARFATISLPVRLIREIERIVETLGYWPTKMSFVREAVVEKLERFKKELNKEIKLGHKVEISFFRMLKAYFENVNDIPYTRKTYLLKP